MWFWETDILSHRESCVTNGESKSCTLHEVLYVPKLAYNLISVTRSASNPMDKGACNSTNSKIQTWRQNTN